MFYRFNCIMFVLKHQFIFVARRLMGEGRLWGKAGFRQVLYNFRGGSAILLYNVIWREEGVKNGHFALYNIWTRMGP